MLSKIVPKDSAILPGYECCGIPADHKGMARFKSSDDLGYLAVSRVLFEWINQIHKSSLTNLGTSGREADTVLQTNSGDMQVTGELEIIGVQANEREAVAEALMTGGLQIALAREISGEQMFGEQASEEQASGG
jgi:hypothetical protein